MELIRSYYLNEDDICTITQEEPSLGINPLSIPEDCLIPNDSILLHICLNQVNVGFFILVDSPDVQCPFDGQVFEVTVAIHNNHRSCGYGRLAQGILDSWVLDNFGRTRLEAVIRDSNTNPERTERLLSSSGFIRACESKYGYLCAPNEWHKVIG